MHLKEKPFAVWMHQIAPNVRHRGKQIAWSAVQDSPSFTSLPSAYTSWRLIKILGTVSPEGRIIISCNQTQYQFLFSQGRHLPSRAIDTWGKFILKLENIYFSSITPAFSCHTNLKVEKWWNLKEHWKPMSKLTEHSTGPEGGERQYKIVP